MEKTNNKLKTNVNQILLFKKYSLVRNIGGGAFGTVFLGTNVWTKENVAIKIEERNKPRTTLEREAYILYYLKGPGLPEVKSFGKTKKYNILIQQLLGRSLYEIFNDCDKKFTIKDVSMISLQLIERLEYIHSKNYIHRDIKPHNFLVSQKNEGQIYIIDFGLAKKFKSERGNHVKFAITKHITGTPRFCSINAMRGVEQSRRDDLESLSYLILYFLRGSLPWQGLKISSRNKRFKAITNLKKTIKLEKLCENFPPEILLFCKYTRKLGFTEKPKYEYMKNLFLSILNKYGMQNDKRFSWIKEGADINNDDIFNYHLHKKSPRKRLIQKIRTSLEKKKKEKSKEKENNDYTLTTIFMENNNQLSQNDISNTNIIKSVQNNNYIQSNDNNILQNNIIQLNINNYKHSYNHPVFIYNKNNLEQKDNNFDKIAKTFQSNDSNILQQNSINIPDKISIIDATHSNLSNVQISDNQIMLIKELEKNNPLNQNKGMKLHDFIRKEEEKEGGVIKNYDFKENEYFKVNTPLYISELIDSSEIESSRNKKPKKKISFNENNKKEIKSLDVIKDNFNQNEKNSYKNLNNNCNTQDIQNNKILNDNHDIQINNFQIKKNSNSQIPMKDIKIFLDKKKISPQNYSPKQEFFIKRATINLNPKAINISPKNRNKGNNNILQNTNNKNNNYYLKIKNSNNGLRYVKTNGNSHLISNNYSTYENSNSNQNMTNSINNYRYNPNNSNKLMPINSSLKNNIQYKKINKKNLKIDTNSNINNKLNTEIKFKNDKISNIKSTNYISKNKLVNLTENTNYINESYSNNPFINNEDINLLKVKNKSNRNNIKPNISSHLIKNKKGIYSSNNNNIINNLSFNNIPSVNYKRIYNSINSNSNKKSNSNNGNNNIFHINSFKNETNKNIIINNVIIKNNCNNLIYKSRFNKNENKNLMYSSLNNVDNVNNKNRIYQSLNNKYNEISQIFKKNQD